MVCIACWYNENRESKTKITILNADARRVRKNAQTNRAKRGFRSRNVGKTITNFFSHGNLYSRQSWFWFTLNSNLMRLLSKVWLSLLLIYLSVLELKIILNHCGWNIGRKSETLVKTSENEISWGFIMMTFWNIYFLKDLYHSFP